MSQTAAFGTRSVGSHRVARPHYWDPALSEPDVRLSYPSGSSPSNASFRETRFLIRKDVGGEPCRGTLDEVERGYLHAWNHPTHEERNSECANRVLRVRGRARDAAPRFASVHYTRSRGTPAGCYCRQTAENFIRSPSTEIFTAAPPRDGYGNLFLQISLLDLL
jgi:hypothetical protein